MTAPYREQAPQDEPPPTPSWWQRLRAWWSPPPCKHEWCAWYAVVVNEQPQRRIPAWVCRRCGASTLTPPPQEVG